MNKFILLPSDIYKGLLGGLDDMSNNLAFAKKEVEKAKKERTDPSTKNIHLNQVLRRYLHMKKEHDEQPIRVTNFSSTTTTPMGNERTDGQPPTPPPPPSTIPTLTPPPTVSFLAPPQASPIQQQRQQPLAVMADDSPTYQQQQADQQMELEEMLRATQPPPPPKFASPTIRREKTANAANRRAKASPYSGRPVKGRREGLSSQNGNDYAATPTTPIIRHERTKLHKRSESAPYYKQSAQEAKKARQKQQQPISAEEAEWLSDDEDDMAQQPSSSSQIPSTSAQARSPQRPQSSDEEFFHKPIEELSREELAWRYYLVFNRNPQKYGVNGDLIIDNNGRPVPRSSVNFSLCYIIDRNAGRPTLQRQPPGTKWIDERINRDPILHSWMFIRKGTKRKAPQPLPPSATRQADGSGGDGSFRPKIWRVNNP